MTETLTSAFGASATRKDFDFGWWDCQRLATAAEMAECGGKCADCGEQVGDKYGARSGCVGTCVGYRFGPDTQWVWTAPLCRKCETLAAIADGYK